MLNVAGERRGQMLKPGRPTRQIPGRRTPMTRLSQHIRGGFSERTRRRSHRAGNPAASEAIGQAARRSAPRPENPRQLAFTALLREERRCPFACEL
jgi:hypothetical protein